MKISQINVAQVNNNNTLNFGAFRIKKGENAQEIVALVERHVRIFMDNSAEGGVVWTYPDYSIVNTLKTDAEREALNAHIEATADEIGKSSFIDKSHDAIVEMVTFTQKKLQKYLAKQQPVVEEPHVRAAI